MNGILIGEKRCMRNIIKICCIGDLHLGVLNVNEMWDSINKNFISYCKKEKPDIIVLCGDTLDEKVSLNSNTATTFFNFVETLLKLNTTILVINGTKTHDENQFNVFSSKINNNFRIYNKACSDYVKGLKILLIPEEYMTNPDSYYKELLSSKYDFCFGHGQFNHIAYLGKKRSIFRRLTAPIWDYEKQFKNKIFGRVVFGHIHTPSRLDKMYYVGSFDRFCHNEEEPKGFLCFEYDKNKKEMVSEKFIENKDAKIFKTVLETDLPKNRDKLITELEKLVKNSYKLRIRLNKEVSSERKSDIITFCKNYLNTSIDLYYERKQKLMKNINEEISDSLIENKYENMEIIDATIEYILEKYNITFDRDFIIKILNSGDAYD